MRGTKVQRKVRKVRKVWKPEIGAGNQIPKPIDFSTKVVENGPIGQKRGSIEFLWWRKGEKTGGESGSFSGEPVSKEKVQRRWLGESPEPSGPMIGRKPMTHRWRTKGGAWVADESNLRKSGPELRASLNLWRNRKMTQRQEPITVQKSQELRKEETGRSKAKRELWGMVNRKEKRLENCLSRTSERKETQKYRMSGKRLFKKTLKSHPVWGTQSALDRKLTSYSFCTIESPTVKCVCQSMCHVKCPKARPTGVTFEVSIWNRKTVHKSRKSKHRLVTLEISFL